jgi:hypothetical protein
VDSSLYPQSSHNYGYYENQTKTFTHPGATSLTITFNSQTKVENGYDYIYVYDGSGKQLAKYTGTITIKEPEKCSELVWCDPNNLPDDMIDFEKEAMQNNVNGIKFSVTYADNEKKLVKVKNN